MKFTSLSLCLFSTTTLAGTACNSLTSSQTEKPNILVIVLDDAGYNDFGFMGSKDIQTPNIDNLAKNGVIFRDAHVSATVSGPSRAGILTGRYQQRSGYECNLGDTLGLGLQESTIGDIFLENVTLINADSSFSTGLYPEAVLISINQRKMINQAVHTIYS